VIRRGHGFLVLIELPCALKNQVMASLILTEKKDPVSASGLPDEIFS
jgi:hypothetical protein